MDIEDLKQRLAKNGCDSGNIRADILKYLTQGPDYLLEDCDFAVAAATLAVPASYVKALYEVESSGNPFVAGRPVILFEPHRFSKLTDHKFDASAPRISYPHWQPGHYPKTQAGRYEQLIDAILLDPLAGFAAASYGAFQILGENYARCDCIDAMAFAWQESQTASDQLHHFCLFIKSDPVLHRALQRGDWVTVAKRYNGTAYYKNRYDVRLAQAQRKAELAA